MQIDEIGPLAKAVSIAGRPEASHHRRVDAGIADAQLERQQTDACLTLRWHGGTCDAKRPLATRPTGSTAPSATSPYMV